MVDKTSDKLLMFCNECIWKEETVGLQYKFCPVCGHVNIGYSKNYDSKIIGKEEVKNV